jgi:hypothetical protein
LEDRPDRRQQGRGVPEEKEIRGASQCCIVSRFESSLGIPASALLGCRSCSRPFYLCSR